MKKQIVTTKDGSSSIYLEEMDEHYHSKHGAITESKHIYIQSGLLQKSGLDRVNILEVGLGTGLNVLTTLLAVNKTHQQVKIHSIEAYPVKYEEVNFLNYPELLGLDVKYLEKIHLSDWEKKVSLTKNVTLYKEKVKLQNLRLKDEKFDVIYFDAFAPEKQPEMWTAEVFEKLIGFLKKDGVLVSYCVKGEVRRTLQRVGFEVEKLAGPIGGKREMCRAWKR